MGNFGRVSPGDDVAGLLFNSEWINAVTAAATAIDPGRPAPPPGYGPARLPFVCRIKNDSGADIGHYGLLGVDGPLFDKTANSRYYLSSVLQFKGVKPKAEHAGRLAFCVEPIKAGKIGKAIIPNAVQCQVNITTATHRFASIKEDDTVKLESGESGTYPMVPAETGTGVKWAVVFMAGGGGAAAASSVSYLAVIVGPVGGIPAAIPGSHSSGGGLNSKLKMFSGHAVRYSVLDIEDEDFGEENDLAEPEQETANSITWIKEDVPAPAEAVLYPDTIARQEAEGPGNGLPASYVIVWNWVKAPIQVGDRVKIDEITTLKGRKRLLITARDCG